MMATISLPYSTIMSNSMMATISSHYSAIMSNSLVYSFLLFLYHNKKCHDDMD